MTLRRMSAWSRAGRAHGAEQKSDRDLAGEIIDEFERALLDDAVERAVGDLERRRHQPVEVALEKGRLAQGAQPVVAGRIGGAEGRAGAARQFVDHIALRRGERLPVPRRFDDVVVARQDPQFGILAPIARVFLPQFRIVRKRVRIDQR